MQTWAFFLTLHNTVHISINDFIFKHLPAKQRRFHRLTYQTNENKAICQQFDSAQYFGEQYSAILRTKMKNYSVLPSKMY